MNLPGIHTKENQAQQLEKPTSPALCADNWLDLIQKLQLSGMTKAVLMQCQFVNCKDNTIFLSLTKKQQAIWQPKYETRILQGLKKHGHLVKIHMDFLDEIGPNSYEKVLFKQHKDKKTLDQKTAKHDLIQTLSTEFHATLKTDVEDDKTSHA